MIEENQDSAKYLLDLFKNTKKFEKLKITCADVSVLHAIAYYLDLNQKKKICFAKQQEIGKRAKLSREKTSLSLAKLKKLKLINMKKSWKLYHIKFGRIFNKKTLVLLKKS